MIWVVVGLAASLVIAIIFIVFVVRKKKAEPIADDVYSQSGGRFQTHVDEVGAELEQKLKKHKANQAKLEQRRAEIAAERRAADAKIRNAGDWDELIDVARNIERRGRR